MREPMMYEASELKYETNITFPRIVIDKYRYQDIAMTVYKIQHFWWSLHWTITERTCHPRHQHHSSHLIIGFRFPIYQCVKH